MHRRFLASALFIGFGFTANPSAAADDKIRDIQDRGVMRVCFADSVPSSYKDPQTGNWVGFNVDMSELVAQELGVKTEYVDSTWSTVIVSLQTGKCDVVMAGLSRGAKRAAAVLFVNPYHVNTLSAVTRTDSPIKTYADIDNPNVTVAVTAGSNEESYLKSNTAASVHSLVTDKLSNIFFEVAAGRADAAMTDTITVRNFLSEGNQLKLHELDDKPVLPKGSSWAVAPGEYQFQQFLNVFLEAAEATGAKGKVYAKWYAKKEAP
jgi:ABC-type amino acid transport substrate-binding protein